VIYFNVNIFKGDKKARNIFVRFDNRDKFFEWLNIYEQFERDLDESEGAVLSVSFTEVDEQIFDKRIEF
tara:strand:- start:18269 stop:18475 length:207 start_codon:yes stop_codon:yes gene_type:complete